MKLYSTVSKEATCQQIIEKSKFITYIKPVLTRQEAEDFIASVKKEHREATHNVPAMIIGDKQQVQWASDDGEPQGTAGAPMLQLMVKMGLTNVAVVVTRYFGGIKLGTGGLARAYSSSASLGIKEAGVCQVWEQVALTYSLDYTYLAKLQSMAGDMFTIGDVRYSQVVEADLLCEPEKRQDLEALVANLTGGKAQLKNEENTTIKRVLSEF